MNILEKYAAAAEDVIFKRTEDNGVLLNLENGRYYTLNKTATFIYSLCDGRTSLTRIAGIVAERYGLAPEQARADLSELVEELRGENLIRFYDFPA